jgi:hypothetical protein
MGFDRLQEDLPKILFHAVIYCQFSLMYLKNSCSFDDLTHIWYSLLPLLNQTSLDRLKNLFDQDKKRIVLSHLYYYKQLSAYKPVYYFFKMKPFKILDIFVAYGLLNSKDCELIISKLIIESLVVAPDLNKQLKNICCMIMYFFKNGLLNPQVILNTLEIFLNGRIIRLTRENLIYIEKKIKFVCSYKEKVNTLLMFSKKAIRNSIQSYHRKIESLNKLNIPRELKSFIINTEKINEFEFDGIYGHE